MSLGTTSKPKSGSRISEIELQLDLENVLIEQPETAGEWRGERVATPEAVVCLNLQVVLANVEIETDAVPIQSLADEGVERLISHDELGAWIARVQNIAGLGVPSVRLKIRAG